MIFDGEITQTRIAMFIRDLLADKGPGSDGLLYEQNVSVMNFTFCVHMLVSIFLLYYVDETNRGRSFHIGHQLQDITE